MAIRNDFAPGEVLAAADLNDTFGSKLDLAGGDTITASGASVVPLTLKGAASQSASLLVVRNSDNNERARIDNAGNIVSTDGTTTIRMGRSGGVGLLGTTSNHSLGFQTNDNERMRIDSAGNIAVNSGADANVRFLVNDSTNAYTQTVRSSATSPLIDWTDATNASYAGVNSYMQASRAANSAYSFMVGVSDGGGDIEFRLRGDGNGYCDGTWFGGGASDYAEYFEWSDGNPTGEDRRGICVTLDGNKIKPAQEGDTVIGVISGAPVVLGDTAWNHWHQKYLRDEYNTYVMEDYDVLQWTDESGAQQSVDADGPDAGDAPADATTVVQQRRKLNPDYNPTDDYVPREDRPEWDAVGLVGKLRVRKGQQTDARWIKMRDISATIEEWLVR
jgi:hypothetical protein